MYSRPAQCSPLVRSKTDAGWVTARSSAIEGRDEFVDALTDLVLTEVEVLEDGVPVGARRRRLGDGEGELLGAQAEVGGQPRGAVAAQARLDLRERGAAAQPRREERADRDLGAVRPRAREAGVDRVGDL